MNTEIGWQDVALRLLCATIAGALIGINRGEHGRAAGLRTTLLVCLAATIAMIQANLLLGVVGKKPDSFVVLDLMRLPLGILTGVGFIGAGAILRRDNVVLGVTTAATLWFVTVMGLCFGGGQIGLGWASLGLGLLILSGLKWIEQHWNQECHATLTIAMAQGGAIEDELVRALAQANYKVKFSSAVFQNGGDLREFSCHVSWRGRVNNSQPPDFLKALAVRFQLQKMEWKYLANQ